MSANIRAVCREYWNLLFRADCRR